MQKNHTSGRRNFIKMTALGSGLIGTLSSFNLVNLVNGVSERKPDDLHLKITGYDYQRIKALFNKKVRIENCNYEISKEGGISDMNTNVFSGPQTFDVTEIGMVPFIIAYVNGGFRDYVLLPVFPLKVFRHKSIFIHADSGITKPEDLKGKKIATPGYSSSSLTWIRGMLQDEYGISPKDIQWVIAREDSSADVGGKSSAQEQFVPEGISVTYGTPGKDESELLLSREVDALFHAIQPKSFIQGNPKVVRLFNDSRKVEQEYFSRTGIFPIMHAVAVRKELLEKAPLLAKSLFDAYSESKKMNYTYMTKLGWAYDSLPWYSQEFEETKKVMGDNYWSYGIDPNRKALEALCRYCHEQGLIKEKVKVEDLFASNSFDLKEG